MQPRPTIRVIEAATYDDTEAFDAATVTPAAAAPNYPSIMYASKATVLASKVNNLFGEKWGQMTEPERLNSVIDIAVSIGVQLGLKGKMPEFRLTNLGFDSAGHIAECGVVASDPQISGYYDSEKHVIRINRAALKNPVEVAKTIAHELRHVYQNEQVLALKAGQPHDPLAKAWESEVDYPIDPSKDRRGYWNQLIERDARDYEEKFYQSTCRQGGGR